MAERHPLVLRHEKEHGVLRMMGISTRKAAVGLSLAAVAVGSAVVGTAYAAGDDRPAGYGKQEPEKMAAYELEAERRRTAPKPFVKPPPAKEIPPGQYDPETEYAFRGGDKPFGVEPGTDRRDGSVNSNRWSGYVAADRYQISAGLVDDGSSDGSVVVLRVPRRGDADAEPVLHRLRGSGALTIVAVRGRTVLLTDKAGGQHEFDPVTGAFG